MPKILQWLSALPNPLAKHSNLSSHSMSKYDGEGALQFCAGCRLFKGHMYTQSPTLLTVMPKHMWKIAS